MGTSEFEHGKNGLQVAQGDDFLSEISVVNKKLSEFFGDSAVPHPHPFTDYYSLTTHHCSVVAKTTDGKEKTIEFPVRQIFSS
jgi:hypothetical protein